MAQSNGHQVTATGWQSDGRGHGLARSTLHQLPCHSTTGASKRALAMRVAAAAAGWNDDVGERTLHEDERPGD